MIIRWFLPWYLVWLSTKPPFVHVRWGRSVMAMNLRAKERRERLDKFRADYFNTPASEISQLAADGMIVVIDFEAALVEAKADHCVT